LLRPCPDWVACAIIVHDRWSCKAVLFTRRIFCCSSSLATQIIMSRTLPDDKINLRLILVCGKTCDFLFDSSFSASDVAQYVFDHWPDDWQEERVQSASLLKLIYHGRFLHGNVTLRALSLPIGKTTVMHLVARKTLPEPNSQDNLKKSKSRLCCHCCSVM
ncbi:Ubiquitin-like protein 3, partial [Trichinella pseudospiralis]